MSDFAMPFHLQTWIDENREDLRPPVANKQLWLDTDMIVMIVGGGNQRTDFHEDPRPEFFHQITGDMNLRIWPGPGIEPYDMPIREGEVFLLPPHVKHSPQRPDPDSVGLVVEYARSAGEVDAFEWVCENCANLVHRVEIELDSIVDDLPPLFEAFYASEEARTCPVCSTVHRGAFDADDPA